MDDNFWQVIGMAKRLQRLEHLMHDKAVEGKHITVYADGELIGQLNLDYAKESQ